MRCARAWLGSESASSRPSRKKAPRSILRSEDINERARRYRDARCGTKRNVLAKHTPSVRLKCACYIGRCYDDEVGCQIVLLVHPMHSPGAEESFTFRHEILCGYMPGRLVHPLGPDCCSTDWQVPSHLPLRISLTRRGSSLCCPLSSAVYGMGL